MDRSHPVNSGGDPIQERINQLVPPRYRLDAYGIPLVDSVPQDYFSVGAMMDRTMHGEDGSHRQPDHPVKSGLKKILLGIGGIFASHYAIFPALRSAAAQKLPAFLKTGLGLVGAVLYGASILASILGLEKLFRAFRGKTTPH